MNIIVKNYELIGASEQPREITSESLEEKLMEGGHDALCMVHDTGQGVIVVTRFSSGNDTKLFTKAGESEMVKVLRTEYPELHPFTLRQALRILENCCGSVSLVWKLPHLLLLRVNKHAV